MQIATTHPAETCPYPAGCTGCAPGRRPAIGTHVRVDLPETPASPAETVYGQVHFHYPDGIDIRITVAADTSEKGDVFTCFDSEQARGKVTVTALDALPAAAHRLVR